MSATRSRFAVAVGASAILAAAWQSRAGETRCWLDHGALVAPAAFGGIAGDFLIDPAQPASQLHLTVAQMNGLADPSVTGELRLAGESVGPVPMTVTDLGARAGDFPTGIVGVIGADVLSRYVLQVDPLPCRLQLSRLGRRDRVGGIRLPLRRVGDRLLFPATVTDGTTIRSGWFALGTGQWSTTLYGARLSRPLPAGDAPKVRLRGVEVAGTLFEQVPAAIKTDPADGAAGVIGMSVLSAWRVRLDPYGGWLELEPR